MRRWKLITELPAAESVVPVINRNQEIRSYGGKMINPFLVEEDLSSREKTGLGDRLESFWCWERLRAGEKGYRG